MAEALDPALYTKIPYVLYDTLDGKLRALLRGETLYIKGFEQKTGRDVLMRLKEEKQVSLCQLSPVQPGDRFDKNWEDYNVGLNDISLFTAYRYDSGITSHENKYEINDVVTYTSSDGERDSAIIEDVYVLNSDPNQYAYMLSRDFGLYAEEDLTK